MTSNMSITTCNGTCIRHPKRTKKRIQQTDFDRTKDAVCRKCEAYFKDITGKFCPCCHAKFSRRLTTMKYSKKRLQAELRKIASYFKEFWEMVTKQYLKKPHARKYMANRRCLLCNSSTTYLRPNCSTPIWRRYLHGYICLKCYLHERKRKKHFANCPLGTLLTTPPKIAKSRIQVL